MKDVVVLKESELEMILIRVKTFDLNQIELMCSQSYNSTRPQTRILSIETVEEMKYASGNEFVKSDVVTTAMEYLRYQVKIIRQIDNMNC